MIKAFDVPIEMDLSQFSRLLWQHKLSHRIHQVDDRQVLAVAKLEFLPEVLALFQQWQSGEIAPVENDSSNIFSYFSLSDASNKGGLAFLKAPVSLVVIIVCCILAVIAPINSGSELAQSLLYPDFSYGTSIINVSRVLENFNLITFFKMFTPALLHGGFVHLAFNMLWLWEFGRRIEARQASWSMILLILVLALVSNSVQYIYGGGNNFVGLSGVVYGLFAYIWMWQLFDPAKQLKLPVNLIVFMLIMLGLMTMIGFEGIADSAHIGGLLCGVVYGAVVATISRVQRAIKTKER